MGTLRKEYWETPPSRDKLALGNNLALYPISQHSRQELGKRGRPR
jgi:hypothetical protein